MKLLTMTLLLALTTCIFAAGADGTSGMPQNVISISAIDDKSSLVCYVRNDNNIECIVFSH